MKRIAPELVALFALIFVARAAGAGPSLAREPRSVGAFHAIELAGVIGVEVSLGVPASVAIAGEPALVGQVTTQVKDGVLVIGTRPGLPDHHHLRAIITAPALDAATLSGTGGLALDHVQADKLAIRLSGTGSVVVDGAVSALRVVIDGTGAVDAEQLAARAVSVDVRGTGSASLRASQSVDARVSGTGSVEVHGKPASVKRQVTGAGNIQVD
jgi:Putative auto-transporter adhesin, head GIN domain